MTIEFLSREEAARADITWPDVYFSPGYGAAVEESDGGRWEVAVGAGGRILSPYLLRPVPEALTRGEPLFDAVTPYGYASTWADPELPLEELTAFRRDLRRRQSEQGVIAEFQRVGGPLPGATRVLQADEDAEAIRHVDTIVLPFASDYDAYWTGAKGRHRTSVRKARKHGFTWEEEPAPLPELLEGGGFRELYDSTMRRVDAKPYYFFDDVYYQRLHEALASNLRLARVRDAAGDVVAGALFMRWSGLLHYHLAGSRRDAARAGANNLLLDGMIAWGFENGVERLHLGGGLTAGDALYRFKIQFGGELLPFYLLRTVLDPVRYATLTERRAEQTGRSPEELVASGFFPAYRA